MSGIVGIFNLSGAPVDASLLSEMTDLLAPRGPDQRGLWHDGCAGLGHTLFRTTDEAASETQPFTFDGKTWIVADARVDARAELVASLRAAGREASHDRPDVELILHAWHAWGEDCAGRLLGDFSFAVWDAGRRRIYCARDHLGIKSLYYARIGQTVIVSNSLPCVRRHPAVSAKLDDLAIADFLLFGYKHDPTATSFADIRRLPPAHWATWTADGERQRRYWTLPIDEPLFLRRSGEYPERFGELLREAVRDRTRTDRIGVLMSGGMDSTLLASFAKDALRERGRNASLAAFTSLAGPDDDERRYAEAVANELGIPIHFFDPLATARGMALAPATTPEPNLDPMGLAVFRCQYEGMAQHARVAFFGEGPDNALRYEWKPYLAWLWKQGRVGRLARDVVAHAVAHRRIPLVPTLLATIAATEPAGEEVNPFPPWLNPGFIARLGLEERWRDGIRPILSDHSLRPSGHGSFGLPLWLEIFAGFEIEQSGAALEVRHPYLDLRLLRFMLQVPALPWCREKLLMRRVACGRLPETVRRRPKAPFVGDPLRFPGLPRIAPDHPSRGTLLEYLSTMNGNVIPRRSSGSYWVDIRPECLAAWLAGCGAAR
jgi:asparagine synthase (glutamine-hydrolysing)